MKVAFIIWGLQACWLYNSLILRKTVSCLSRNRGCLKLLLFYITKVLNFRFPLLYLNSQFIVCRGDDNMPAVQQFTEQ